MIEGSIPSLNTLLTENERLRSQVAELQAALVAQQSPAESATASPDIYRALFEEAQDAIFLETQDDRILDANRKACELLGYSRQELLSLKITDLLPPAASSSSAAIVRAELAVHGDAPFEGLNRHQDGSLIPVEVTFTQLHGAHRDKVLVIVRDIRVRKQAEADQEKLRQQVVQAQKLEAIGQLTAGIAHDFNNTLTVINGYAELLSYRLPAGDAAHDLVNKVLSAGRRASSLIGQLMVFGRKQGARPTVIEMNDLLAVMTDMLRRIIGEDILLETNLAPELWPLKADAAQIEQVLVNLALNARDSMPTGGQMSIETYNVELDATYTAAHAQVEPGPYVCLVVSDTGPGLTPGQKAHLFEPLFDAAIGKSGPGLGMATIYALVKQNHGHVWVYSEEGQGTSFKVYLPASPECQRDRAYRPAIEDMPIGDETILLVEDDQSMREVARYVLEGQGYTVLEAPNGAVAQEICASYPDVIHLLVTDVIMPGIGGRDLSHILIQMRSDLKALFVSGYADRAIVQHGVLDANAHFLQKPFSPVGLACKVRDILDTAQKAPHA